jgi:hypothetical protein
VGGVWTRRESTVDDLSSSPHRRPSDPTDTVLPVER